MAILLLVYALFGELICGCVYYVPKNCLGTVWIKKKELFGLLRVCLANFMANLKACLAGFMASLRTGLGLFCGLFLRAFYMSHLALRVKVVIT